MQITQPSSTLEMINSIQVSACQMMPYFWTTGYALNTYQINRVQKVTNPQYPRPIHTPLQPLQQPASKRISPQVWPV